MARGGTYGLVREAQAGEASALVIAAEREFLLLQRRQHPEHATGLALCRSRAGLAMSQDGRNWARIEAEHHTGAVLDAGEPGAWDAAFVGAPQVRRVLGHDAKIQEALRASAGATKELT